MPFGSVVTVNINGVIAAFTVMLNTALDFAPVASCACAVKTDKPGVVGTPEMMPVVAEIVSPAGSAPEMTLHEYGELPPVAERIVEYAMPTVPAGGLPPITVRGAETAEIRMTSAVTAE